MMQRYQFVLYVCTCPTLFRRTYQYADFAPAHPIKHILFLLVGLCAVNIRNFSRRNAKRYKFPLDVIVHVKIFQRIVILIFFFGHGHITEDNLRTSFVLALRPYFIDIPNALIYLICGIIRNRHIIATRIESNHLTVMRNAEHIVDAGIDRTRSNPL